MDASLLLESITTIGLTSALVVFFVWISWQRENRLANRVTELEHQLTDTVLKALNDNTAALHELTIAITKMTSEMVDVQEDIKRIEKDLSERPCAIASQRVLQHLGIRPDEE